MPWVSDSDAILLAIGLSVIGFFGPFYFYQALASGKVSIVSPLSKSYILIVVLVGVLVL